MNQSKKAIGKRIKALRDSHGYSPTYVFVKTGITQTTLHNYEKGIYYPKPEYLIKLSDFFNVSTDYILGLKEQKN